MVNGVDMMERLKIKVRKRETAAKNKPNKNT